MKIFQIKIALYGGEKTETKLFLVKCETYARAEEMAYEQAESYGWKMFDLVDVVKKQISEVHKDIDTEQIMWLVKYEHGLEAKPDKSNILVSGMSMIEAHNAAFEFLDPLCNDLLLTSIVKTDLMDYIKDTKTAEELVDDLKKAFNTEGISMTFKEIPEPAPLFPETSPAEQALNSVLPSTNAAFQL